MIITRYTDYSLRILTYLALNGDAQCTIQAIADSYAISKNHLMKIVQALNAKHYLLATRGKNGGLKLRHSASKINLGQLVREMEDQSKLVECFGEDNQCVITPSCRLKGIFSEALESFFSTLDKYTLQDLIEPPRQHNLAALLTIPIKVNS